MRLEYWSSRKKSHWFSSHFWSTFCFPWLAPSLAACHTFLTSSHTRVNTSLVTQRVTSFVFFVHSCKQENKVSELRNWKLLSSPVDTAVAVVVLHLVVKHSVLLTLSDWMFLIFLCELWHSVEVLQFWLSFKFVTAVHLYLCMMLQNPLHYKPYILHHITINVHNRQGQDINLSHIVM